MVASTASVTSNGLSYATFGEGSPVVLAGGTGMPPAAWEACGFVDALVAAGFMVVSYAARGVAPSAASRAPYTIEEMTDDLAQLIEECDLESVHVVGYSLGGFQAELLARVRPDLVRSAVLIASAGPLSAVLDATIEAEGELLELLGHVPSSFLVLEGLVGTLPPDTLRDDPEQVALWRELLSVHADVWTSPDGERGQWHAARAWTRSTRRMADLDAIESPVLVLAYEHDLKFPPSGARESVAKMTRAHFVQVDGASHGGVLTHTHETAAQVTAFLADVDGGPQRT